MWIKIQAGNNLYKKQRVDFQKKKLTNKSVLSH